MRVDIVYASYTLSDMTTLHIRIEPKTKKAATKALADVGLDMSSAVKLFLHQVITEKGLPFTPTRNPAILKAKWDKAVAEALNSGRVYKAGEDVLKGL